MQERYIPATPYARKLAKERGVPLADAVPTGPSGAVRARDIQALAPRGGRRHVTPLAARVARDLGVDTAALSGSGAGGKVQKCDVLRAAQAGGPQGPAAGERLRVRLSGMRKTIAARMAKSHADIPPVTHIVKVDVTALAQLREQAKLGGGPVYSLNDYILLAVARALRQHMYMLVSLDGDEVVYKNDVHLGIAVALEAGLLVPVLRHADGMTLAALSAAAGELAARARAQELLPDAYEGHTFTVTNLGMLGVESFTPIIHQPDAAILGIGCIQEELALQEGVVSARKVLRTCLTYDHRLLDGAAVAQFQRTVQQLLEHPEGLA